MARRVSPVERIRAEIDQLFSSEHDLGSILEVDVDGKPVFVGLAPASSESTDAWDDFLADLKQQQRHGV